MSCFICSDGKNHEYNSIFSKVTYVFHCAFYASGPVFIVGLIIVEAGKIQAIHFTMKLFFNLQNQF